MATPGKKSQPNAAKPGLSVPAVPAKAVEVFASEPGRETNRTADAAIETAGDDVLETVPEGAPMAAAVPSDSNAVNGAGVVDLDRLREDQLLTRLRAGEDSAFEELVRDVGGRLLSVARRMLPNDEDAQDAVQDAFVSAFRALPNFDGKSRLSTWLHRIVVNASLMKLRTKRRKPLRSIDDLMPKFFEDGHHVHPSLGVDMPVDKLAAQTEVQKAVREAIDELPEDYRTVLVLRDLQGLDTAEAAEVLEITPNAVKTRLHRARLALRELMRPRLVSLGELSAENGQEETPTTGGAGHGRGGAR